MLKNLNSIQLPPQAHAAEIVILYIIDFIACKYVNWILLLHFMNF